jgi:hypothetical protein
MDLRCYEKLDRDLPLEKKVIVGLLNDETKDPLATKSIKYMHLKQKRDKELEKEITDSFKQNVISEISHKRDEEIRLIGRRSLVHSFKTTNIILQQRSPSNNPYYKNYSTGKNETLSQQEKNIQWQNNRRQ